MIKLTKYGTYLLIAICLNIQCRSNSVDSPEEGGAEGGSPFVRSEVYEVLRRNTAFLNVYSQSEAHAQSYLEWCLMQSKSMRFQKIKCEQALEVDEKTIHTSKSTLLGTPATNPHLFNLLAKTLFEVSAESIAIDTVNIEGEALVLVVNWFPNPTNPSQVIRLISAAEEDEVLEYLRVEAQAGAMSYKSADIQVYQKGERLLSMDFTENYDLDWSTLERSKTSLSHQGSHLGVNYEGDVEISEGFWLHWSQARETIEELFPHLIPLAEIDVRLYSTAEQKGLRTQNMESSHTVGGITHSIHNEIYKDEVPSLWIAQLLENSDSGIPSFWSVVLGEYVSVESDDKERLLAHNVMRIATDMDYERWKTNSTEDSPLVRRYVSYVFVDYLIQQGKMDLISSAPSPVLQRLYQECKKRYSTLPPQPVSRQLKEDKVWRGFNFAHEGYAIHDGYAGSQAGQMIEQQSLLGANTIAVVPYSYLRNPRVSARLPVIRNAGAENDASVASSVHRAQLLGLSVLLKPQIYIHRSWPGDLYWEGEELDLFWESYRHWILHYALLGESLQIHSLSIGTEMARLSLAYPDRWRELIADLRTVFSGRLTYAANWGEEVEGIEFWEDLDFVGCNCYYPLSEEREATDEQLSAGIQEMLAKMAAISDRSGRSVWFTEIGYKSIDAPWRQPHDDAVQGGTQQTDQARIYSLVCEAVKESKVVTGIWWWKWPSYIDYADRVPRGFTPATKEAEEVLHQCW